MNVDKVYASWTELWDMNRYIEHYLRTRRRKPHVDAREQVRKCIQLYPGVPPFTKSSLDYFLDKNFGRRE
jgi:hypothetical protein